MSARRSRASWLTSWKRTGARLRLSSRIPTRKWGMMMTGASWSVWQSFPILSRAGAAGRIALIEEGAKLLGVSPQSCTARDGVVHGKGKSISYGDIVALGDMRRAYTPEQ